MCTTFCLLDLPKQIGAPVEDAVMPGIVAAIDNPLVA